MRGTGKTIACGETYFFKFSMFISDRGAFDFSMEIYQSVFIGLTRIYHLVYLLHNFTDMEIFFGKSGRNKTGNY